MGLDMYLHGYPKKYPIETWMNLYHYDTYCQYIQNHPDKKMTLKEWAGEQATKPTAEELQVYFEHKDEVREELAYWRKANQIHRWFEEHVAGGRLDDCESYLVTPEQLTELKGLCERTLNAMITENGKVVDGREEASQLLPTEEGFFFGPTQYDEYYVEDLKNTIEQIDQLFEHVDFDNTDVYYYAWW